MSVIKKFTILTFFVLLNCCFLSQEYPIVDVTNIEKDTVYSLIDISLINGKVFDHYENGIIKLLIEFKDGIKNGDYKKWHSNGQLKYKGSYSNGIQDGVFEEFDVFGRKISKTKYKDGVILWAKDFTDS